MCSHWGDNNDVYAITSESMKLLSNVAYGNTLANKAKHVFYSL